MTLYRRICVFLLGLMTLMARGADGELRVYYLGNLSTAPIAKQEQIIAQLQQVLATSAQEEAAAIVLAPGNLLGEHGGTPSRDAGALALLSSLHPMAVGVGEHDLKWGATYLDDSAPGSDIPWLGAIWPAQQQYPAMRTALVGGLSVAVLRLALPGDLPPSRREQRRLRRQFDRLRQEYDLLILLGNFSEQQSILAAALFPQVELIIGATNLIRPESYGHTVMAPIEMSSPYFGGIELAIRDGKLVAWRGGMLSYPLLPEELPEWPGVL